MMYILNIAHAIKQMTIKSLKGFVFENYYKRVGFPKDESCYSMKRYYPQQLKFIENLNNDIKSAINIKH